MVHEKENKLSLPVTVIGRSDINRLLRELKALNDFMDQSAIRAPGSSLKLPHTTRSLDELAKQNKLNLLQKDERAKLENFLERVKTIAPALHISFAVEPPAAFMQKVVTWLRSEIHPEVLVQIGLQPNIAAGCVVRSPNHYFDLSLRQHFADKKALLLESIEVT